MKRYNLVSWLDGKPGVIEDIEGEFVRYEDVQKLEQCLFILLKLGKE